MVARLNTRKKAVISLLPPKNGAVDEVPVPAPSDGGVQPSWGKGKFSLIPNRTKKVGDSVASSLHEVTANGEPRLVHVLGEYLHSRAYMPGC